MAHRMVRPERSAPPRTHHEDPEGRGFSDERTQLRESPPCRRALSARRAEPTLTLARDLAAGKSVGRGLEASEQSALAGRFNDAPAWPVRCCGKPRPGPYGVRPRASARLHVDGTRPGSPAPSRHPGVARPCHGGCGHVPPPTPLTCRLRGGRPYGRRRRSQCALVAGAPLPQSPHEQAGATPAPQWLGRSAYGPPCLGEDSESGASALRYATIGGVEGPPCSAFDWFGHRRRS
jgi:hypothetical protein